MTLTQRWELHVKDWKHCERCELAADRKHVCLGRGDIPADVLFCGEAAGQSENVLGRPFVGPAGQLLDLVIQRTLGLHSWCSACLEEKGTKVFQRHSTSGVTCPDGHGGADGVALTYFLTNLVGCIPYERDEDGKLGKAAEPEDSSIKACAPRLIEIIDICQPKLVVCVGKLAEDWLANENVHMKRHIKGFTHQFKTVNITHPAAILRANVSQRGLAVQRCVVTINTALTDI